MPKFMQMLSENQREAIAPVSVMRLQTGGHRSQR
jgi:hypothetical protein